MDMILNKVFSLIEDKSIKFEIIVFLSFLMLGLAVYWPNKDCGFVVDGNYVVAENPLIKQPSLYKEIFRENMFFANKAGLYSNLKYYRPVVMFSFIPDYLIYHVKAYGYRITNILIHVLNAFFVYYLIVVIFKKRNLGFLSSLIFLILPVQEWVVNYAVGRTDLLQMFFSLLSLISFYWFLKKDKKSVYVVSILCYLLAVLSREVAIILPFYMVLIAVFTDHKFHAALKKTFGLFFVAILYFLLRKIFLPIISSDFPSFLNIDNFVVWFYQTWDLALRFVMPWSVWHNLIKDNSFISLGVRLFVSINVVLYFVLINKKQNFDFKSIVNFSFLWMCLYFSTFWITNDMIKSQGPYLAEHFLYFASIGFSLLAASSILAFESLVFRRFIFTLIFAYFLVISVFSNSFWKSENEILLRVSQTEWPLIHISTKQLLIKNLDNEAFVEQILKNTKEVKDKSIWYTKLGEINTKKNSNQKALQYYRQALEINSFNLTARNLLAVLLYQMGQSENAINKLNESLSLDDQNYQTNKFLGQIYYDQNQYEKALDYFKRAYFLNPDDFESEMYLLITYYFIGNSFEYQSMLDKFFNGDHNNKDIISFMANEFSKKDYHNKVIELLEKSGTLLNDEKLRFTMLANSYYNLGLVDTAYQYALKLRAIDEKNKDAEFIIDLNEKLK